MTDFGVYCPSAGRPMNVPRMQAAMAPRTITWVVPDGQQYDYKLCGAEQVIGVTAPPGCRPLAAQRNAALEHAFQRGLVCVQTDDDIKSMAIARNKKAVPASIEDVFAEWQKVKDQQPDTYLYGVNAVSNHFFARDKVTQLCIYGWLFAVWPSEERFDETLPLSEDIDFTCQHIENHGSVARLEWLIPSYTHADNAGGCQNYRTEELERATDEILLNRWPQYLKMNPKRLALIMKGRT